MLIGTKAESFDRMKRNPTFFFCNATFSTGMPHNKKKSCVDCTVMRISAQGDYQTARFADTRSKC